MKKEMILKKLHFSSTKYFFYIYFHRLASFTVKSGSHRAEKSCRLLIYLSIYLFVYWMMMMMKTVSLVHGVTRSSAK